MTFSQDPLQDSDPDEANPILEFRPVTTILDVPIKWTHLLRGRRLYDTSRKTGYFPHAGDFRLTADGGIAREIIPCNGQGSAVLIRPNSDFEDIRDWLDHQPETPAYEMYGRFETTDMGIRVMRCCHGVVFLFEDQNSALLFYITFRQA